jgi:pimeloyl-ACP methyl ester carboxylesterase
MPRVPWTALLVILHAGCASSTSTSSTPAAARGDPTMHTVKSLDGTPIAYARTGHGPPLVLVHGTSADRTRWAPLLPRLEQHFTVYAVDRRGRGGSGDAPAYALEREFEDVAAVVQATGEPAYLLGHSHGAICSLEAATRVSNLKKLVLYEPPIFTGVPIYEPGSIDRLQGLLDAGDRAGVVTTFFRDVVHMPPGELGLLQSLPNWPARVAAAHTLPRELRANEGYRLDPARLNALRAPTLLLLGGDSPAFFKAATESVHGAIPTSRVVVLPGQQHAAMNTAPDLFLREVLGFLAQ